MKRTQTICLLALLALTIHYAGIAQDVAKNNAPAPPAEKKTVTTAPLTPEEIAEGKGIITDAQKLAATREAAIKVFTETIKNTAEARLLAYDSWWAANQSMDGLQAKMNKLVARAQDRTG